MNAFSDLRAACELLADTRERLQDVTGRDKAVALAQTAEQLSDTKQSQLLFDGNILKEIANYRQQLYMNIQVNI